MSEERRKRQEDRDGSVQARSKRKKLAIVAIVVVLVAGYYALWRHRNHRYDQFAQCLTARQAKMYGLYWCPHCQDQKELFGGSFNYVNYVECGIEGVHDETAECKAAGAKLFPSWKFGDAPLREGLVSMDGLSEKTGCSLP
jgi:hypothetical protein